MKKEFVVPESAMGLVRGIAARVHKKAGWRFELEELIALGNAGLVDAARRFDPEAGACFETFAYYRVRGAIYDGIRRLGKFSSSNNVDRRAEGATQDEQVELARRRRKVAEAVAGLPDRERALIIEYYYRGRHLLEVGTTLGLQASAASRVHGGALALLRAKLAEVMPIAEIREIIRGSSLLLACEVGCAIDAGSVTLQDLGWPLRSPASEAAELVGLRRVRAAKAGREPVGFKATERELALLHATDEVLAFQFVGAATVHVVFVHAARRSVVGCVRAMRDPEPVSLEEQRSA